MTEDVDVEALLEDALKKKINGKENETKDEKCCNRKKSSERDRKRSRSKDRHHSDRHHKRSRSRDKKKRSHSRKRDRDRKRSRSKDRKRSSKDRKDRKRSRSRHRHRSRSRQRHHSKDRKVTDVTSGNAAGSTVPGDVPASKGSNWERDREGIVRGFGGRERRRARRLSISPQKDPNELELTPEEQDARTVFCMQLAARIRPKDLEEFFSAVGKVRDVRLILDSKSRRSKGIAYIEFADVASVPLAIGLSGQRLLGVPILVQQSFAEKNRIANAADLVKRANQMLAPNKLYAGNIHVNISEEMLKAIFEPFGRLSDMKLIKDHGTGVSAGYAFITFQNSDDAKKAMDQLNGFELAGKPMKIGMVTDNYTSYGVPGMSGATVFDVDEVDRQGFGLGATGRLQLMARLAEGTGMQLPDYAANALSNSQSQAGAPPITTQCFMLSNMFDITKEKGDKWVNELRDEVLEQCNKHGGALHIYIDIGSTDGNVYVKSVSVTAAAATVAALHGRYFAGKVITAAYVPLNNYNNLFPDSMRALELLKPMSNR